MIFKHYNRSAIKTRLMLRGYKLENYEVRKNGANLGMFVARATGAFK